MRWAQRRDRTTGANHPAKLLAWALTIGLLFGLIGAGEYAEDRLRVVRNHINERPASRDIVLVSIDEKSVREVGRWPWPRGRYAKLVTTIGAAKPLRQVHDINFPEKSDPAQDRALVNAFASTHDAYLPYLQRVGAQDGAFDNVRPFPALERRVRLGSIAVEYNYANEVWRLQYANKLDGGRDVPMFASLMAGRQGKPGKDFRINYAFAPSSVPTVSAADVLDGKVDPRRFEGKTVIVGVTAERLGDQFMVPGWGKYGGVYVQILGAETLKAGHPIDLGWSPAFILAAFLVAISASRGWKAQGALLGGGVIALLGGPVLLERSQIFIDITPGLFVILWVAVGLALGQAKRRGLTNTVSGLPNLNALRRATHERDRPLIVARIVNYPQIVSTLSPAHEKSLIDQIVSRLKVGSEVATIYQGDEGIFAWTVQPGTAIGHHIEALHALFRSPAKVDRKPFDISVSFGVEIGSGRTINNRLGSALVAADEATGEGLRWKYHDPERLKDADWRLSLLSQLDDAIDHGQVWVAYQPQVDLRTGWIRGAEALARWTHPEKGPISPNEFIAAAEQSDRIDKLTMFVLDRAVAAAAKINREHGEFDMAVNLSARMLSDKTLSSRVRTVLDRHQLPPERLTLELTETATLANNGSDLGALFGLRELGVRISIDDYGTGLSTLEYLKKIPASEIKIDQSFVKSMRDHRSDLVMVQSTIALAHSLGRTVVAEGVETREILDLLIALKCEVAQGFVIGRPSSLNDLTKRLLGERKRRAA